MNTINLIISGTTFIGLLLFLAYLYNDTIYVEESLIKNYIQYINSLQIKKDHYYSQISFLSNLSKDDNKKVISDLNQKVKNIEEELKTFQKIVFEYEYKKSNHFVSNSAIFFEIPKI